MYFLEALAAVKAFGGEAERSAVLIRVAEALLEECGEHVHRYYVSGPSESCAVVPGPNWSMVAVLQKKPAIERHKRHDCHTSQRTA